MILTDNFLLASAFASTTIFLRVPDVTAAAAFSTSGTPGASGAPPQPPEPPNLGSRRTSRASGTSGGTRDCKSGPPFRVWETGAVGWKAVTGARCPHSHSHCLGTWEDAVEAPDLAVKPHTTREHDIHEHQRPRICNPLSRPAQFQVSPLVSGQRMPIEFQFSACHFCAQHRVGLTPI